MKGGGDGESETHSYTQHMYDANMYDTCINIHVKSISYLNNNMSINMMYMSDGESGFILVPSLSSLLFSVRQRHDPQSPPFWVAEFGSLAPGPGPSGSGWAPGPRAKRRLRRPEGRRPVVSAVVSVHHLERKSLDFKDLTT